MSNLYKLRRRIRSTRNVSQVTRAMQAVSAAKLGRVRQMLEESRPYQFWTRHILAELSRYSYTITGTHPLLMHPKVVERVLVITVSADRGLCGTYVQSVIHQATTCVPAGTPVDFLSIGKKGTSMLALLGEQVIASFDIPRALPSYKLAREVAVMAMDEFISGHYQEIYVAYTQFHNLLVHKATCDRFLPLPLEHEDAAKEALPFAYEPPPEELLAAFLPRALEMKMYNHLVESVASEHSARMVAMENATRNAENMVQELTLAFNKARQRRITREILDIAGGAEGLSHAGRP
jgi:F-type H+-transporting ATPase subunit gamma